MKKDIKTPRIIFMGTPDFAVGILDKLIQEGKNIVAVITSVDKPAGRGRKIHESAVKKYALEHNLAILQPKNLKNEDFLKELASYKADLQIVVAFRMLPKLVWAMPKMGTFNLHASLLPDYRGAAPINWAIINGEKKSGATTFFIDDKIDTGNIILQEEVSIKETDTVGDLHDKLMHLGADLVVKTVNQLEKGKIKTISQKEMADTKPAPKLYPETCKIDWSKDIDTIYNHIRGLSPYPSAWTTLRVQDKDLKFKIYKTSKEIEKHKLVIGTLVSSKKSLKVAVKNGFIILEEVQLAGKRKMKIQDLRNGLPISEIKLLA
jgi:methionyl-tRNA formyltransferase